MRGGEDRWGRGEEWKRKGGRTHHARVCVGRFGEESECVGLCSVFDVRRKGLQTQLKPTASLSPVSAPGLA